MSAVKRLYEDELEWMAKATGEEVDELNRKWQRAQRMGVSFLDFVAAKRDEKKEKQRQQDIACKRRTM